ncbi:hypothetical protein Fleli_0932 [Bernardetia litoralis DSM 6794]|uniref:Uncharacterized protein n=1 Tax=Bernardetia litoralis (strain ATCC 23117 / DSM 6794 / NBRC 15988 / NCIMB 1366 / Fx l1 / Sio-4) TaxID=880071 RepID=I4AHF1_BERLS|nr:hypothetical protein [Bernardetia litoralis]AFM03386.1 hypothetical protein Fleli_0932 [Bernardetia litoralis DSM 6794]
MKKQIINKSTLPLAVLAVACWCFYFWQEKENQEFIEETQGIVIDFNEKNRNREYIKNRSLIDRVNSSWVDSIGFVDKYPKSPIKEMFYKNIPKEYNDYLQSIYEFESEFFYAKRYNLDFEYNNVYRKKWLSEAENKFWYLTHKHSDFEKADLHTVNWKETNDETIWLDLVQQRREVIQLVDSIFEANKKQFPTSYVSNNFEGYSTLIPNYETQTMLIKVYWFPSDTKYYSDYGIARRKYISSEYISFQLGDSVYNELKNPRTYHVFTKETNTVIFPIFDKERLKKMEEFERKQFEVPFKIISKKSSK